MPKRIPFHIVYATSEDSSYPACELNAQTPAARGWRSVGAPPHELLLRLQAVASVTRLQLLAHHQLIPESVEVLVSGGLVSEGATTPCGAAYTSVGRVALARPQHEARSRELRSAVLPEPTLARFVKLKLSGPHAPAKEDEQVALMAVNVLGDEVQDTQDSSPTSPAIGTLSPYDDLAFVMYVDNEIADLIRSLDERKRSAAKEERFEYARRLKSAGAALTSAGIRIGRWRLRKRTAAARDDYELARRMRDRIADALVGVKEDGALCRLFEDDGPDPRNDSSMHQEYDFSHHLSPSVLPGSVSMDIPSPVPPVSQEREFDSECLSPVQSSHEDIRQIPSPQPSIYETNHIEDEPDSIQPFKLKDEEVELVLEEQRKGELRRIEEVRRDNELKRIDALMREEQRRIVQVEDRRKEEERAIEEQRKEDIRRKIEENRKKIEDNRRKIDDRRIEEERRLEEQKKDDIRRKIEDRRMEEESRIDEQRKEDMKRIEEHKREQHKREEKIEEQRKEEELIRETDSPRRSITPNAANGQLVRRRNKSAGPRSTFEAYEERLLPALRHSHTNEFLRDGRESRDEEVSAGSSTHRQNPPHKLNEREKKQAALPILIFGYPLVEKFYSKNYIDKEEGLAQLRAELTAPSNGSAKTSPNKTARAAAILLQRMLREKVFSVYSQANETVRALFQYFVPDRVCAAEIGRCLEKLLPELLRACGDPAPRVHSTAQHTVLTIADIPQVRALHIIPQQLVRPVPASMHPRLALSRLQMLEQLLHTHGISTDKNSGLTVRRVAEAGASAAGHATGAVRAAAERVLGAAYRRSPRLVRAQLPPDDSVTRRNLIYRHLFQLFDKIDMEKLLNQAPTEDHLHDQSVADTPLETASISQSMRSGTSCQTSYGMTSSLGPTSSYSLKSMASSVSGVTLAPSSCSSLSNPASRTKSSLKKTPTKRYIPSRAVKDFSFHGYNKLRLDSATSPKHSPKPNSGNEKVHFKENHTEEVVFRRSNRNTEHRHSMIHYDHETSKPNLRERPITVYEPLHIDYRDSPNLGSPKISRNDLRSMDSLESPRASRNDLRCDSDSLESPRMNSFRDVALESPKLVAGLRNLHLDDSQMEESGYYSPGRRQQASNDHQLYESYEAAGTEASCDSTPEPMCTTSCTWCGRKVRSEALEAHYTRRCVMLARCPHCKVAMEARALHTHLLEECSMSEGCWKPCRLCGVALRSEDNEYHSCIPLGLDEWKCPYCFMNVLARDLPWQRHLLQCPRNPRLNQNM